MIGGKRHGLGVICIMRNCLRCGNKLIEVDNTTEASGLGADNVIILYCKNCRFRKVKGDQCDRQE